MPFPWQRACIRMKGVLIALFWVTMTKIGKFQQNRWLCVAQLFKWLQRIALNIINFEKPFLNFIDDTMIWYLNSKLDLNLSCAKDFRNLNSMGAWCINWRGLLALKVFQGSSLKLFPIIKRLAITLVYCNRVHAWWSTQSRLANLLSSLIARRWVGLQTLWRFRLKDFSIDEMVGAWYFGCLSGPPGFTCWISFALVFSFIYCWVLIFASSPCCILICVLWEMMHW